MPIVISRNEEQAPGPYVISQEQREALWAAFVTSWLDKNAEQFAQMLSQSEK